MDIPLAPSDQGKRIIRHRFKCGELHSEGIGYRCVGEVPSDYVAVALAATAAALRSDAALLMECHHRV